MSAGFRTRWPWRDFPVRAGWRSTFGSTGDRNGQGGAEIDGQHRWRPTFGSTGDRNSIRAMTWHSRCACGRPSGRLGSQPVGDARWRDVPTWRSAWKFVDVQCGERDCGIGCVGVGDEVAAGDGIFCFGTPSAHATCRVRRSRRSALLKYVNVGGLPGTVPSAGFPCSGRVAVDLRADRGSQRRLDGVTGLSAPRGSRPSGRPRVATIGRRSAARSRRSGGRPSGRLGIATPGLGRRCPRAGPGPLSGRPWMATSRG